MIFIKEVRSMIANGRRERPARTASFVTIEGLLLVSWLIGIVTAAFEEALCAASGLARRRNKERRILYIFTFS
jgi:hypothetical protein